MSRLIVLDSGPLGLLTNPKRTPESEACVRWLRARLTDGDQVAIPAIVDYELRRELLRAQKARGLSLLDAYVARVTFVPLTTDALRLAADLWAAARRQGLPTADPKALDVDVILAAQARLAVPDGTTMVVATANVAHLSRFVPALLWEQIT